MADTYLRGWNIPPFVFVCVVYIHMLVKFLFGSVMTHKLSRIGIIIDLKFIYIGWNIPPFWFCGLFGRIFTRYREWWSIPLFVLI